MAKQSVLKIYLEDGKELKITAEDFLHEKTIEMIRSQQPEGLITIESGEKQFTFPKKRIMLIEKEIIKEPPL
jgi:hypothetical protein